MEKIIVLGPSKLSGRVKVSGAKNVAMKVIIAAILTDEPLEIHNIPLISSVLGTIDVVRPLGVTAKIRDHTVSLQAKKIISYTVPLEMGGLYRTAPLVLGPLLSRFGKGIVPNPGGCRLGKRPIDRFIDGLMALGAKVVYKNGFFHAQTKKLSGTRYRFLKNTHTGTEALILASVLAKGTTILENAAQEPEVDDLIKLLTIMGGRIERDRRVVKIEGVPKLHGGKFTIMPDRNEAVTFAIAALATRGDVIVEGTQKEYLGAFFAKLEEIGGGWEQHGDNTVRFYWKKTLQSTDIATAEYPGFMTDWQAPWSVLMTQAHGRSTIHERVFEHRFGFVKELRKMGAKIEFFHPQVEKPEEFYNFNWLDKDPDDHQAVMITGDTPLHNAVVDVTDIRAGATLMIASLCAKGETVLYGSEHIDRGYEKIDDRFRQLGADMRRAKE